MSPIEADFFSPPMCGLTSKPNISFWQIHERGGEREWHGTWCVVYLHTITTSAHKTLFNLCLLWSTFQKYREWNLHAKCAYISEARKKRVSSQIVNTTWFRWTIDSFLLVVVYSSYDKRALMCFDVFQKSNIETGDFSIRFQTQTIHFESAHTHELTHTYFWH